MTLVTHSSPRIQDGKTLAGYNIMVGGGMGRTHNKETTFARAADHLGYVDKADLTETLKSILAAQRDHGNREVRANARLKYLVHTLGVENFRKLVESYMGGKKMKPWVPLPDWKMVDWMGWHPQGDGKYFLGVNVEQGRVIDRGDMKLKSFLRAVVDKFNTDIRLTPTQSVVLCGIDPKDKDTIDGMMKEYGIKGIEEIDPFTRRSIACPAFPLCGLAQAEAERVMPDFNKRMGALMDKMGMPGESFVMRMTGCPNGCARPYMAEVSFVGQGPNLYQVWLGGSPDQAGRTGWHWKDKMKMDEMEATLEPVFYMYKTQRTSADESVGDFCQRVGKEAINKYVEGYVAGTAFKDVKVESRKAPMLMGSLGCVFCLCCLCCFFVFSLMTCRRSSSMHMHVHARHACTRARSHTCTRAYIPCSWPPRVRAFACIYSAVHVHVRCMYVCYAAHAHLVIHVLGPNLRAHTHAYITPHTHRLQHTG